MSAVRIEHGAWIIAVVGSVACAIGWIAAPSQFAHGWLAALTCWIGWPLGSLALIFIHALTGGRWGLAIRDPLLAGVATLPLLLPAAVPIWLRLRALYPWMHPEIAAHLDNHFFLNAPFFYVRAMLYLLIWLGLGFLVQRAMRQPDPQPFLYRLAPPGLILLALTVTFSAIDFTLSMEPHFKSSIYGMVVGCEAVLLALSIAVLATALAPNAERPETVRDLGRLLFGLLVLWAYLDFMQVLIVWNSDLPDESAWYLERLIGGWKIVAASIALFHFLLPFFALIWPQVQRSRKVMGAVAAMLALIEVPRAWWIVIPASGSGFGWVDVAAMLAVLGVGAGIALRAGRHAASRRKAAVYA